MSGIDLVTLAALLGHSRIQMVLRYAHSKEEHQFNAVHKLEAFSMAADSRELDEFVTTETVQ
jgi:site-specific recombinase XerD